MEPFNIGLVGEEIEASPDFDDLPVEPPKKKIRRQRKSTTKKERDCFNCHVHNPIASSTQRYLLRDICWPCRLSANFTAEVSIPAESSSLESLQQDVVLVKSPSGSSRYGFFRHYIHEIDTVNTFGRPPLTLHVLSAFTVINDETRKYFAIYVCTAYYRVGHSPLILYYELLILVNNVISKLISKLKPTINCYKLDNIRRELRMNSIVALNVVT